MVLSSALGYSPHPPVSVCGTDGRLYTAEIFLGVWHRRLRRKIGLDVSSQVEGRGFACVPPYDLEPGLLAPGSSSLLHPSSAKPPCGGLIPTGTGMLTRLPSTTPFGLALGSD
jgi:hypothetical protein